MRGEEDQQRDTLHVLARAGVAHGRDIGGYDGTLVDHETRRVEGWDALPGPASQARRRQDGAGGADISVQGTMRECDGLASQVAAPRMTRAGQAAELKRQEACVSDSLPGTMRACDMVTGVAGAASAWRKTPAAPVGAEVAARLAVAGRADPGASSVKKPLAGGELQESATRVVAELPGRVQPDKDGLAPSVAWTSTNEEALSTAPGAARATAQRLPGDTGITDTRERQELDTDRGFAGLAVGRQALRDNPYTHRRIP